MSREFRLVQELCSFLGLRDPLHMNFEKEYWTEVFEPIVASYERGETLNPDVGCNQWVKFGGLLRRLEEVEAHPAQGMEKGQWWFGHRALCENWLPTREISYRTPSPPLPRPK